MKCPICKDNSGKIWNIEWYIPKSFYNIYHCKNCDCNHMDMARLNKNIYNEIYSNPEKIAGYDRYFEYFKNIKTEKNPLYWLAKNEEIYLSTYEFFKNKIWLNCLEIWTWLWYLTYAINQSWNKCIWLDISKESITMAKKSFWNFYILGDITDKNTRIQENFDVIIATELIEHIDNFDSFFNKCFNHLKKWWYLIITTPNKDFYWKSLWFSDLPPVHTILFSKKTFKYIAEKYNSKLSFSSASDRWNINNLITRIYHIIFPCRTPKPHFEQKKNHHITIVQKFIFSIVSLMKKKHIKKISNIIHSFIFWKWNWLVLHCIFQKKY